jgi:hypothetical protein
LDDSDNIETKTPTLVENQSDSIQAVSLPKIKSQK